ncbi:NAD-dependent malic enzyme-like protein [Ilyonectria robusta]
MERLIDKPGLLTTDTDTSDAQKGFAKSALEWKYKDTTLQSVIETIKPNVLIGTSTVPGAFTESIVKAMAKNTPRPIILPLSNPTRLHEAKPADLLAWTDGKALVATGSPFDPVTGPWGESGADVTIDIAECNNSVVFPGIGLGCVLARVAHLTDRMLVAAVEGLAALSPALTDSTAPLLPDVSSVRDVSVRIARNVIQTAIEEGEAMEEDIPSSEEELEEWIREQMWNPVYRPLKFVEMEGATRAARGELKRAGTFSTET